MFFSALLTGEGLTPQSVETEVSVTLGEDDTGPCITAINLICHVACDGLTRDKFDELASIAKDKCPVSRLYAGSTAIIGLDAKLVR